MCSPRPVSAREPGVCGTGAARLGSATAHSTPGPCCSRPSRIGRRGPLSPDPGRACRSTLVSSSDTTIAMSWLRSASPHRCKAAMVKSRPARTDPACAPSVRAAIRGRQARPVEAGSGDGRQLSLATPAISAASISQRQPVLPARSDGCAATAVRSISSRQREEVRAPACCHWPGKPSPAHSWIIRTPIYARRLAGCHLAAAVRSPGADRNLHHAERHC